MAAKITVNGVAYDSVDAMPPNVRSVYEQTVANVPELADRDGDGIPDIVKSESISVRHGVTVHKKIVVNGTTYENEAAMPPDIRQLYERAMRSMSAGEPTVKKNVINLSFQVRGPGFTFRNAFGGGAAAQPMHPAAGPAPTPLPTADNPMPGPIEPAAAGAGLRIALILGVGVVGGLVIWFLMRAH